MTISHKWISEYIPLSIEPQQTSNILTSIGLEVESMEKFESVKGGLQGLVTGEVKECTQHPGADKLKLTKVEVANGEILNIVCGAPNVAEGQKVIVATAGTTIYPTKGDPVTIKNTKIRGEESFGMICAEDEIGLGESHAGIVILPGNTPAGVPVAELYKPYSDWIYEIGLTPNRMDAMSHAGVARDICAYLSHHEKQDIQVNKPATKEFSSNKEEAPFEIKIENTEACKRYTGVTINGIRVQPSPQWLQDKLKAIGQRPINNIVDITNYMLHDTGQPLHAFDADKVAGKKIIVKNLPEGTVFKSLDEKERKLSSEDLMICDGNGKGMCIAGVFGGFESGVKESTANIFLESAWFNPVDIRKTSFRHGLRTDAATRFEKNVDISQTLNVLKRAASLIVEVAGGKIVSDAVDEYPNPEGRRKVSLEFKFLEKLSGKSYPPASVKNILKALGFEVLNETNESVELLVPYSKPDISLQADIVEEVMRIDGYDNIEIPARITISPSSGAINKNLLRRERIATLLAGAGFSEIFTNSITNIAYFTPGEESTMVKLLNNLSAVHNVMRPSMLETGLESVAYNLNRKNDELRLFEFGKTYHQSAAAKYNEHDHLCLYITGSKQPATWKGKAQASDIYFIKGIAEAVLKLCGWNSISWQAEKGNEKLSQRLVVKEGNGVVVEIGSVAKKELNQFDIRQPVFFADFRWQQLTKPSASIQYQPLSNQLPVSRDLAMVVDAKLPYADVEKSLQKLQIKRLRNVRLFDVFESEKIGKDKKSLAVNFTFVDDEKTLTDKEIDGMMTKIMRTLEQDLNAEIRKGAENITT